MDKNDLVQQDELDDIEEELREVDQKEEKTHHKVSGKSIFVIKEIIKEKGNDRVKENRNQKETQ